MSKKFGLMGLATIQNKYLDGNATLNCSDVTAAGVDEEVMKLLKESYDKALELLRDNRQVMDKLAEYLIEKETITGKEFMRIYRQEKGIPEPEEDKKEEKNEKENGSSDTEKMNENQNNQEFHEFLKEAAQTQVPQEGNADPTQVPQEGNAGPTAKTGNYSNVDADKIFGDL